MNDQECLDTYEDLAKLLNEQNMEWVTDQVASEIREGKTVQRLVDTIKDGKDADTLFATDDGSFKKGPKATFSATVEYSPLERLELLIGAIRQAIVTIAEMEQHLAKFYTLVDKSPSSIQFQSDEPESKSKFIGGPLSEARAGRARILQELLGALGGEIRKS